MLRKKGLAFKLGLYLLSVGFIVLFAILFYNYTISRDLALKDAQNDAMKLTELTVARIENVLNMVENIPSNLASVIENRDTILFVGTRLVIEEVLRNNPLIYGASIAFAPRIEAGDTMYFAPYLYHRNDSIIFKNLADDGYNYTQKDWFASAQAKGHGIWTEPYFDKGGGDALMATYAVPFYRKSQAGPVFAGVVTADLSLKGLQELIESIRFFDSGRGFLISSSGNIVTWPEIDSIDHKLVYNIYDEIKSPELHELINNMVRGESGLLRLESRERKEGHEWISYANVPSTNWSLGIIFKESELYEGIYITLLKLVAIGIAGFIVLSLLILYISRRFVKPIEKLAIATKKIGEGNFNVTIPSFKSDDEISQLGQSFRHMQSELREYVRNLKEATAQRERIESELDIANGIQQQMLPDDNVLQGSGGFEHFGLLRPARQIGGDLYDIHIEGDQLYFTIGDVSGKGIPAALFMARTLTLFRAKVTKGLSPEQIAWEINRDLSQHNLQSMFVTCFIGLLNLSNGDLKYCNAGHNPPYLIHNDRNPQQLKGANGIPLGSMPGAEYGTGSYQMSRDEMIFMYTDGISEAEDRNKNLYGEKRLEKLLSNNNDLDPKIISESVLHDLDSFASGAEQADDITMLVLKIL